jgi:hypothetical protein
MASLYYSISIVGDCTGIGSGSISIFPNGGTPPYNVNWISPSLGTDLTIISSTRSSLYSGLYTLEITDSSLPINNSLLVSIPLSSGVYAYVDDVKNTSCGSNNGSVTGTSSALFSQTSYFLYDGLSSFISSAITDSNFAVFDGLSAGTYYIMVLDVGGCTGRTETFVVEPSTELDYGFYVVPNSSCGIGSIGKIFVTGQTGTPPYTYLWSNGETGSTITGLTSGLYSVNVTDYYGCTKISATTITNVNPVSVTLVTPVPPSCLASDGSLTFYLTGGTPPYYYSASTGYFEISYSNVFTLGGLSTGPYSLLVTDAAYCTTTASALLATPEGMTSVNVNVTNAGCTNSDGSMFVYLQGGTPPYIYTLIYPDGNNRSVQTTNQNNLFSFLSGGTYSLYVTDNSGCTFNQEYSLISETPYTITTSSEGATFNRSNGVIVVTKTTGGTEPFNYILDGSKFYQNTSLSSVTFTNVSSGQHEIKVTDALGCSQVAQVFVGETQIVDFLLFPTDAGSNSGGTLTALISSGEPPFTYEWSSNVSGNPQTYFVQNLTGGTYSLTIIDVNGSSQKREVTLSSNVTLSTFSTYNMNSVEFVNQTNSKLSLSKMLNEGFYDLTTGNTGCNLVNATFSCKIYVEPYGTEVIENFYTTTSLVSPPTDNLWNEQVRSMILKVKGVSNVVIDELNNELVIISDPANAPIVNGTIAAINIKVYLVIDYEISCSS